jgi:hypothetical protein
MNIDKWVSGYKVRAFPWIDKTTIFVNVAYYKPGQSICQPPVWEKTVYLTDNQNGNRILSCFLDSFVRFVAQMHIENQNKVVITA